jgi:signal transduction histidine kinase
MFKPFETMSTKGARAKIVIIAAMIGGVSFFHYSTELSAQDSHIFYQGLYFLPVLLAGFWFGLRGALAASASITLLYLPFTLIHWGVSPAGDFTNVQVMVLYNLVAVILGNLSDRERKKQLLLREAESLAAIGKAASYLAQDMRIHLAAVGEHGRSIKDRLTADNPLGIQLNMIIQEAYWLEKLVSEILAFSRPLKLNLSKQDIQSIINDSLGFVGDYAVQKNVTLQAQVPQDLPPFSFDRIRIMQVIVNLLLNAIHASPYNDSVRVSAARMGRQVIIDVSDHGDGIPPEKRKEVFLPFYSTKEGGTGLGLSVARKIVNDHRGRMHILDNNERGVVFRVSLPFEAK